MVRFGLPFLSSRQDTDYERLLARLQKEITEKQVRVDLIQNQLSRVNRTFYTYGLGVWIGYTGIVWTGVLGAGAAIWVSVILLLFGLASLRNVYQWWLRQRLGREKAALESLAEERKKKVEELKQKTGYYTTQGLLEKYELSLETRKDIAKKESAKKEAAEQRRAPEKRPQPNVLMTPRAASEVPVTPLKGRAPEAYPVSPLAGRGVEATPAVAAAPAPPPGPPPRPGLFDRIVDKLLGISEQDSSPTQQYALICHQCYAHNGLALKDEFPFIKYVCPVCGYFNGDEHWGETAVRQGAPYEGDAGDAGDGDAPRETEQDAFHEGAESADADAIGTGEPEPKPSPSASPAGEALAESAMRDSHPLKEESPL